jgi:hypothetical protein
MKWALVILTVGLLTTGCRSTKDGGEGEPQPEDQTSTEVIPVVLYNGQIALVKAALKYVVIEGGIAEVPPAGTKMNAYRGDRKVGEVKVSAQSRASNYAADIVSGSLQVGDTVRND